MHAFQLVRLDERVDGHMHARVMQMGITNSAFKRFVVKINGAGTRAKGFVAEIHGVCAAVDGSAQSAFIAGGAEQFGQIQGQSGSLAFA